MSAKLEILHEKITHLQNEIDTKSAMGESIDEQVAQLTSLKKELVRAQSLLLEGNQGKVLRG
jgi:hypothetical protein